MNKRPVIGGAHQGNFKKPRPGFDQEAPPMRGRGGFNQGRGRIRGTTPGYADGGQGYISGPSTGGYPRGGPPRGRSGPAQQQPFLSEGYEYGRGGPVGANMLNHSGGMGFEGEYHDHLAASYVQPPNYNQEMYGHDYYDETQYYQHDYYYDESQYYHQLPYEQAQLYPQDPYDLSGIQKETYAYTEIQNTANEPVKQEKSMIRVHPIKALQRLYPQAIFKNIVKISNTLGTCLGYEIEIEGKTFYGEGTNAKIAKGLAALDALTFIKAPDTDKMAPVCNMYSEMKLCEEIKVLALKQKKLPKNASKEQKKALNMDLLTKKLNAKRAAHIPPPPTLVYFQQLRQRYVRQNSNDLVQTFNPGKGTDKTCVLIVQGHVFRGDGANDKVARDNAAKDAVAYFEANPPEFVLSSGPPKAKREPAYDRPDPTDYTNMLFCKAWKVAAELTKDISPCYVRKQNLAFVLKVCNGHIEDIDKTEVVAIGCGTKVINREYMNNVTGFVINDSAAQSLCIRAFRKYLLDELTALMKDGESVFRKNPFGKIMLKEGYRFIFVNNCSPMGDCKNFDRQYYNMLRNNTLFDVRKEDSVSTAKMVSNKKGHVLFDPKDCGKIHWYRKMVLDNVCDQCVVPTQELSQFLHPIPSSSDKLAVRNVCGVQGALLSTLIEPIYFPEFYVGRAYDQTALERALYSRLLGMEYPDGISVNIPKIMQLTWKPSRMADKATVYSFLWSKGNQLDVLRADIGSVIEMIKPTDISNISEEMMRAYDSREIKSASPSQYCPYNYYLKFTELLQLMQKPVDTYVNTKKSAALYQSAKEAAYNTLFVKGLGAWPVKPDNCKPKF